MNAYYEIESIQREVTEAAPLGAQTDILKWVGEEAPGDAMWLLAHAYTGVIWGKKGEAGWDLSSGLVPNSPALRTDTLLQLRVFGPEGELFAWRDSDGLHARALTDGSSEGESVDYYDEPQMVWGDRLLPGWVNPKGTAFTALADGEMGMVHAVPFAPAEITFGDSHRPIRLIVRHYVECDADTGLARVTDSRLLDVKSEPPPPAKKGKEDGSNA